MTHRLVAAPTDVAGAAYLPSPGPRAVAGCIRDLASRVGGVPVVSGLLAERRQRIGAEALRVTRGRHIPRRERALPDGGRQ